MWTASWTAVGGTVAGAAIGWMLPSIGDKVVNQRRVGRSRARALRAVSSGAATAVVIGVLGYRDPNPTLVAWCWLAVTGICLAVVDIDCQRLPRALVGAMAGGGLAVFVVLAITDSRLDSLFSALLAAAMTLLVMVGLAVIVPEHIGGVDVTLLPVLALYLGWCGWTTVALGVAAGTLLNGLYAAALFVVGRAGRGTRVAAGPMLILGALAAIAIGAP